MFPSHIGSHSTGRLFSESPMDFVSIPHWFSLNEPWDSTKVSSWCFHPTLVLTQLETRRLKGLRNQVSIPHWFSLNELRRPLVCPISFPSHIGSHSTRASYSKFLGQLFPSHIGSHSTGRLFSESPMDFVSIPHWFSLNWVFWKNFTSKRLFPSHIGSHSTDIFEVGSKLFKSFHPTLVLTQRESIPNFESVPCFHPTLVLAQLESSRWKQPR